MFSGRFRVPYVILTYKRVFKHLKNGMRSLTFIERVISDNLDLTCG